MGRERRVPEGRRGFQTTHGLARGIEERKEKRG